MGTYNEKQEAKEIYNNNNNQQEAVQVLITKQQKKLMNKRSIINGNGKKTLLFRINKRKKLPSIRLGGKKGFNQQVVRLIKRIKLKWIKLRYSCMLKKLKSFYYSMLKDLMDANYTTYDSMQQRIMMESYFSVPLMGVSIISVPSYIPNKFN